MKRARGTDNMYKMALWPVSPISPEVLRTRPSHSPTESEGKPRRSHTKSMEVIPPSAEVDGNINVTNTIFSPCLVPPDSDQSHPGLTECHRSVAEKSQQTSFVGCHLELPNKQQYRFPSSSWNEGIVPSTE